MHSIYGRIIYNLTRDSRMRSSTGLNSKKVHMPAQVFQTKAIAILCIAEQRVVPPHLATFKPTTTNLIGCRKPPKHYVIPDKNYHHFYWFFRIFSITIVSLSISLEPKISIAFPSARASVNPSLSFGDGNCPRKRRRLTVSSVRCFHGSF
jgi:hypothetical protein